MSNISFCFFDTAIGRCGIVWSARGIAAHPVAGRQRAARQRAYQRRFPEARRNRASAEVQHAIDAMVALLAGEPKDLSGIRLDTRRRAGLQTPGLRRRPHHSGRRDAVLWRDRRASRRSHSGARCRRRRSGKIRFRSSCRVIACWRPAARPADFRRPAACDQAAAAVDRAGAGRRSDAGRSAQLFERLPWRRKTVHHVARGCERIASTPTGG